ncbi:MAG TPA: nucleotide exchange factor GrpE, partial [Steroidobacteraceae bacterium]|nr:nucleotide exchange factor GrpE [Steroidobacteraceae bacterium]
MDSDSTQDETSVLPETAAQLAGLEQLQQQLTQAEERAKSHWDQHLRAVAELENLRKRAQRDVDNATRAGLERFAHELLPVMDSLAL